MDSPTQPTFLPHEAVASSAVRRSSGGGLAELFLLVSVLLFVVSGALAVGVFLYTQYLGSSNASKLSQLNAAEASFDPSLIEQLTRLDTRMTAAQALLSAHLAPSELFSMLQSSTVQDISFSSLTLDATNPQQITLTMEGVAGSVNSIALQAQVFSQSGIIQNPIFSDIDAEQKRRQLQLFRARELRPRSRTRASSPVQGHRDLPERRRKPRRRKLPRSRSRRSKVRRLRPSPHRAHNNSMVRNSIALILLAGAIAIFFFYTEPAYSSLQTLSAQGAQYDAALGKATELQTPAIPPCPVQFLRPLTRSIRLSTMFPDQVDNIRLILDLDNLAGRSGMALQNVNISTPGSSQASSVVGSIASAAEPYDSLTLQFTTHGTYEQFTQFLASLQSSLRLVDLVTLNISGGGAPGTQDPQYTYTMTVQTYWLR